MYFFSNFINSIWVMIIGMVVVFIGLVILIGGTQLMSKIIANGFTNTLGAIFGKISGKGESEGGPAFKLPKGFGAKKAPAEAPVEAPVASDEYVGDAQLIAVITAAILAMDGAASSDVTSTGIPLDLSGKRLVVRSVRRLGGAWGQAGRAEQTIAF